MLALPVHMNMCYTAKLCFLIFGLPLTSWILWHQILGRVIRVILDLSPGKLSLV